MAGPHFSARWQSGTNALSETMRKLVRALARAAAIAARISRTVKPVQAMMMRAAIYTMFSEKEKQSGKSIEDQVALCRAFCKREGHIVVEVYSDHGISGPSTVNRTGFQRLMPNARSRKFDVIEVSRPHLTRPRRPGRLSQRTRSAGVQVIAVQDNIVADDLQVGVKGLFACS